MSDSGVEQEINSEATVSFNFFRAKVMSRSSFEQKNSMWGKEKICCTVRVRLPQKWTDRTNRFVSPGRSCQEERENQERETKKSSYTGLSMLLLPNCSSSYFYFRFFKRTRFNISWLRSRRHRVENPKTIDKLAYTRYLQLLRTFVLYVVNS